MNEKTAESLDQKLLLTAINYLMVGLMLTCFAFMLGKLVQTVFPGWSLMGFPAIAFIITLEAMVLKHIQGSSHTDFQNQAITTLVEIIIIILLLKLISMLFSGFSMIWLEITSWQDNFFPNFFDPDFLVLTLAVLFIRGIAGLFSQYLIQLEEDENLMEQEKLGFTFNDRQEARRGLISLVFIIGFGMIVSLVLMKNNITMLPDSPTSIGLFIIILLIYFFAGFVFLALNQYAIMKARWYFDDIQVSPSLALRWLLYTWAFILVVILVIVFLPTNFTVGFYPIAQAILDVILFIFGIIQFLFTLPIALVVSLVNALNTDETVIEQMEQNIPEVVYTPPEITNTLPWLDVVKSIFFWLLFIGVIVFSIHYYLKNRQDFKAFLDKIKIGKWLRQIWRWISSGFSRLHQAAAETLQKGVENVRTFIKNRKVNLPSLADLGRGLPPRQAVILAYIDWIHWSEARGLNRRKSQTPAEYAQRYQSALPEAEGEIMAITQSFIQARYTRQEISRTQAQAIRESLTQLKTAFQARERQKESE